MITVAGVVIIGGSGTSGPTLSDATPAALGVAAAGVSADASRADHVHALPTGFVPGATTAEDMTGTGWTATTPAGMTATWAASKLTLSGTAGTGAEGYVTRASVLDPGAQSWELVMRLQMTAGYNSGLSFSQSGYLIMSAYLSASTYVSLILYSRGTIGVFTNIAGGFTNSGVLAPAPSQAQVTGGQLWFKLRGDTSGRWVVSWGVGTAGALPQAWQRVYTVDSAPLSAEAMATAGWRIFFGSETTRVQLTTIDVLAIRSTWQGSL